MALGSRVQARTLEETFEWDLTTMNFEPLNAEYLTTGKLVYSNSCMACCRMILSGTYLLVDQVGRIRQNSRGNLVNEETPYGRATAALHSLSDRVRTYLYVIKAGPAAIATQPVQAAKHTVPAT